MLKLASLKSFAKFALVFASSLLFSHFANAGAAGAAGTTGNILCNALSLFTGNLGKTLAIFALIALGVSFFMGKISWGTVLAVAFGIACIFGGATIVNAISGASSGSTFTCSGTAGAVNI